MAETVIFCQAKLGCTALKQDNKVFFLSFMATNNLFNILCYPIAFCFS